jgi:gas vesicle protein
MKFGKRYSKVTVFMAMLHGVLIGVAAVAVIGLLLVGTKGKDNNTTDKEVPASGPAPVENSAQPAEKPLQLYAKQHGAFSSAESATSFIAEDPSLSKAAVIQSNNKYLVWTAVGLTEEEIIPNESEGTFRKAFTADTLACGAIGAGKLRQVLTETDMAKIKNLDEGKGKGKEDAKTKEFYKNITTITAFTKDLQIMRLHLISDYSNTGKCVKISF